MGSTTILEVKNLMVFFENAIAINNISLHLREGEFGAVLGSNGAGKTTLLNTISGLILDIKTKEQRRGGERITIFGEVWFEGQDVSVLPSWDRARRGMVLVRERHPVFTQSSVEENLRIATVSRRDAEVDKDIEKVYQLFPRLKDLRRRKAGFCSGGEQQMLMMAMALMVRPKLLLLDEPLLGLAPALQRELIDTLCRIRESGVTILIAEQFARPLLPRIDRAYVIENGMLVIEGTGEELMDNPEVKSAYFGV